MAFHGKFWAFKGLGGLALSCARAQKSSLASQFLGVKSSQVKNHCGICGVAEVAT